MKNLKLVLIAMLFMFIGMINTKALTCKYIFGEGTDFFVYTCEVTSEKVTCNLSNGGSVNWSAQEDPGATSNLVPSVFESNGSYACENLEKFYVSYNLYSTFDTPYYAIHKVYVNESDIKSDIIDVANIRTGYLLTNGTINSFNISTGTYETKKEEGPAEEESGKEPEEKETTDWTGSSFCQRDGVQGVFTTIGWVIFILKILVPILVIVFGSIDFAKAVVASKEDEIKKAGISLVKRIVIGILIFLIPTILDFIIGVIGGDDIYNEDSGSFGYCTHCMLKPSECKNLRGN